MLRQNFKIIFCYLLITGVLLPSFALAQGMEAPKTLEEAKTFGLKIVEKLPDITKDIWKNQTLPILGKIWTQARPIIEPWKDKLLNLLRRKVEKEIKKELPKIKESLWQNFLDRFKDIL